MLGTVFNLSSKYCAKNVKLCWKLIYCFLDEYVLWRGHRVPGENESCLHQMSMFQLLPQAIPSTQSYQYMCEHAHKPKGTKTRTQCVGMLLHCAAYICKSSSKFCTRTHTFYPTVLSGTQITPVGLMVMQNTTERPNKLTIYKNYNLTCFRSIWFKSFMF